MFRITFTQDGRHRTAYVIASHRLEAEEKLLAVYKTAVIVSAEPWPYDIVVV